MLFIKRVINCDFKRCIGFTLMELMIVLAIIGILCTIGTLTFQSFAEKARVRKAVSEILSFQTKIKAYAIYDNLLPDSLDDIKGGNMLDPWGNPYQYVNFRDDPKVKCRKDRNLHPLNTDFDLYSMGKDGMSEMPLTADVSWDDIIRANDGQYVGRASDY
jgi:general secretion pathway protein G